MGNIVKTCITMIIVTTAIRLMTKVIITVCVSLCVKRLTFCMVVTMKIAIFCDMIPHNAVDRSHST